MLWGLFIFVGNTFVVIGLEQMNQPLCSWLFGHLGFKNFNVTMVLPVCVFHPEFNLPLFTGSEHLDLRVDSLTRFLDLPGIKEPGDCFGEMWLQVLVLCCPRYAA